MFSTSNFQVFLGILLLLFSTCQGLNWVEVKSPKDYGYTFKEDVRTRLHTLQVKVDEAKATEYFRNTPYVFGVNIKVKKGTITLHRGNLLTGDLDLNLASFILYSNQGEWANGLNFTSESLSTVNLVLSNLYYLGQSNWNGQDMLYIEIFVEPRDKISLIFNSEVLPKYSDSVDVHVLSHIDMPEIVFLDRKNGNNSVLYGLEDSTIPFPFLVQVDSQLNDAEVFISIEDESAGELSIEYIQGSISHINQQAATINFVPREKWSGTAFIKIKVVDSYENIVEYSIVAAVAKEQKCHIVALPSLYKFSTNTHSFLTDVYVFDEDAEHSKHAIYKATVLVESGSLALDFDKSGLVLVQEQPNQLTISGNIIALNQALLQIQYISNQSQFAEKDKLTITVLEEETNQTSSNSASIHINEDYFSPQISVRSNLLKDYEDIDQIKFGKEISLKLTSVSAALNNLRNVQFSVSIVGEETNGLISIFNNISHLVKISGNISSSVFVQGPFDIIAGVIDTLIYVPNKNLNSVINGGPVVLVMNACIIEDSGEMFSCSDKNHIQLDIVPVNDVPEVFGVPESIKMRENSINIPFPSISIVDIDSMEIDEYLQVHLSVQHYVSPGLKIIIADIPGIEILNRTSHEIAFKGREEFVSQALRKIEVHAPADYSGQNIFKLEVIDSAGGLKIVEIPSYVTLADRVAALKYAKTEREWFMTIDEDSGKSRLSQLSLSPDRFLATISCTYTLSAHAKYGKLNIGTPLTGIKILQKEGSRVVFSASNSYIEIFNHSIGLLEYFPNKDWNGYDTIEFHLRRSISGEPEARLADMKHLTVHVRSVNDAPTLVYKSTSENEFTNEIKIVAGYSTKPFTMKNIIVEDVDFTDNSEGLVVVNFTVLHGRMTLLGVPDQIMIEQDNEEALRITGKPSIVTGMIQSGALVYLPQKQDEHTYRDTVTVVVNDLGNNGIGGPKYDTLQIGIVVEWQNSPPKIRPMSSSLVEPVHLVMEDIDFLHIPGLQVSDLDDEHGNATVVTISIEQSVNTSILYLGKQNERLIKILKNETGRVVFMATINDANLILNDLSYHVNSNWIGSDMIDIVVNDNDPKQPYSSHIEIFIEVRRPEYQPRFLLHEETRNYYIEDLRSDYRILLLNLTLLDMNAMWGFLPLEADNAIYMQAQGPVHISLYGAVVNLNAALAHLKVSYKGTSMFSKKNMSVLCRVDIVEDSSLYSDEFLLDLSSILESNDDKIVKPDNRDDVLYISPLLVELEEDTKLYFAENNLISICADCMDIENTLFELRVSSSFGDLFLEEEPSHVQIKHETDGYLSMKGMAQDINVALNKMVFLPSKDWNSEMYNEVATINFFLEPGIEGSIEIFIKPVNDPPTFWITINNERVLENNLKYKISQGDLITLSGLTVEDVDLLPYSTDALGVSIRALNGNVESKLGDKVSKREDRSIYFEGNVEFINGILEEITYLGEESVYTKDVITISLNDPFVAVTFQIHLDIETKLRVPNFLPSNGVVSLKQNVQHYHVQSIGLSDGFLGENGEDTIVLLRITAKYIQNFTELEDIVCEINQTHNSTSAQTTHVCMGQLKHIRHFLGNEIYYSAPANYSGYETLLFALSVPRENDKSNHVSEKRLVVFVKESGIRINSVEFEKPVHLWKLEQENLELPIPIQLVEASTKMGGLMNDSIFVNITTEFGKVHLRNKFLLEKLSIDKYKSYADSKMLILQGKIKEIKEALTSLTVIVEDELRNIPENISIFASIVDTYSSNDTFFIETQVQVYPDWLANHRIDWQNKISSSQCSFSVVEDSSISLSSIGVSFNQTFMSTLKHSKIILANSSQLVNFNVSVLHGTLEIESSMEDVIKIKHSTNRALSFDALFADGINALESLRYTPLLHFNSKNGGIEVVSVNAGLAKLDCSIFVTPVNDLAFVEVPEVPYDYYITKLGEPEAIKLSGISIYDVDSVELLNPDFKIQLELMSTEGELIVDYFIASKHGVAIEKWNDTNITLRSQYGSTDSLNLVLETLEYRRGSYENVDDASEYIQLSIFDGKGYSNVTTVEIRYIFPKQVALQARNGSLEVVESEVFRLGEELELQFENVDINSTTSTIEILLECMEGDRMWSLLNVANVEVGNMGEEQHIVLNAGTITTSIQEVQEITVSAEYLHEIQQVRSSLVWPETFILNWYGKSSNEVAHNASESEIQIALEKIPGLGHVNVSRNVSGYETIWDITFLSHHDNDIPILQPFTTMGTVSDLTTQRTQHGGLISGFFSLKNQITKKRTSLIPYNANSNVLENELQQLYNCTDILVSNVEEDDAAIGKYAWRVTFPTYLGDVDMIVGESSWLQGFEANVAVSEITKGYDSFMGVQIKLLNEANGRSTVDIPYYASVREIETAVNAIIDTSSPIFVSKNLFEDESIITWSIHFESVLKSTENLLSVTFHSIDSPSSIEAYASYSSATLRIYGTIQKAMMVLNGLMFTPHVRGFSRITTLQSSVKFRDRAASVEYSVPTQFFVHNIKIGSRKPGVVLYLESDSVDIEAEDNTHLTMAKLEKQSVGFSHSSLEFYKDQLVKLLVNCSYGQISMSVFGSSFGVHTSRSESGRSLFLSGTDTRVKNAMQQIVYNLSGDVTPSNQGQASIVTVNIRRKFKSKKSIFLLKTLGTVSSGTFSLTLQVKMSQSNINVDMPPVKETDEVFVSNTNHLAFDSSGEDIEASLFNLAHFPKGSWVSVKRSAPAPFTSNVSWEVTFFHGVLKHNNTVLFPKSFELSINSDNITSSEATAITSSKLTSMNDDVQDDPPVGDDEFVLLNGKLLSLSSRGEDVKGALTGIWDQDSISVSVLKFPQILWTITLPPQYGKDFINCVPVNEDSIEVKVYSKQKGELPLVDEIGFHLSTESSDVNQTRSLKVNLLESIQKSCIILQIPEPKYLPLLINEDELLHIHHVEIRCRNAHCKEVVKFSAMNGQISVNSLPFETTSHIEFSQAHALHSLQYRANKDWNGVDTISIVSNGSTSTFQVYVRPVNDAPIVTTPSSYSFFPTGKKTGSKLHLRNIYVSDVDDSDTLVVQISANFHVTFQTDFQEKAQSISIKGDLEEVSEELWSLVAVIDENKLPKSNDLVLTIQISDGIVLSETQKIVIDMKGSQIEDTETVKMEILKQDRFFVFEANTSDLSLGEILYLRSTSQGSLKLFAHPVFGSFKREQNEKILDPVFEFESIDVANRNLHDIFYEPMTGKTYKDKVMISVDNGTKTEEITILVKSNATIPYIKVLDNVLRINDESKPVPLGDYFHIENVEAFDDIIFRLKVACKHGSFTVPDKAIIGTKVANQNDTELILEASARRLYNAIEEISYLSPKKLLYFDDVVRLTLVNIGSGASIESEISISNSGTAELMKRRHVNFILSGDKGTELSVGTKEELLLDHVMLSMPFIDVPNSDLLNVSVSSIIGRINAVQMQEDICHIGDRTSNFIQFQANVDDSNRILKSMTYFVEHEAVLSTMWDRVSIVANTNSFHLDIKILPSLPSLLQNVYLSPTNALETDEDTALKLYFSSKGLNGFGPEVIVLTFTVNYGGLRAPFLPNAGFWVKSSEPSQKSISINVRSSSIDDLFDSGIVAYIPDPDWNGISELNVNVEFGNGGILESHGDVVTRSYSFEIIVHPIPDPPLLIVDTSTKVTGYEQEEIDVSKLFNLVQPDVQDEYLPISIVFELESGTERLKFSSVEGSVDIARHGFSVIQLTGTCSDLNVALGSAIYISDLNTNGWRKIDITVLIPGDENNSTDVVWIRVYPANVKPKLVNQETGQLRTEEDEKNVLIQGISVLDVSEESELMLVVNVSVSHGHISIDEISPVLVLTECEGLPKLAVYGDISSNYCSIVFQGKVEIINRALGTLSYSPFPDWYGTDNLIVSVKEKTGSTEMELNNSIDSKWDGSISKDIFVQSVLDIPSITFNTPYLTAYEGEKTQLGRENIEKVMAVDSTELTVNIGTSNGLANLSIPGISAVSKDILLEKISVEQLNGILYTLEYNSPDYWCGRDRIWIHVQDNLGSISNRSLSVQVMCRNLSPSFQNFPEEIHTQEEAEIGLFADTEILIVTRDDVCLLAEDMIEVLIESYYGYVKVSRVSGVYFPDGSEPEVYSLKVSFRGCPKEVRKAISSLMFMGENDFNGKAQVDVTARYLSTSWKESVYIFVTPVNDLPLITFNGNKRTLQLFENGTIDIADHLSGITVADVDSTDLYVNISVLNGTITVDKVQDTKYISSHNLLQLYGPINDLNRALRHVVYKCDPNFNGVDVFVISVADNTKAPQNSEMSVLLNVLPLNTKPIIHLKGLGSSSDLVQGQMFDLGGRFEVEDYEADRNNDIIRLNVSALQSSVIEHQRVEISFEEVSYSYEVEISSDVPGENFSAASFQFQIECNNNTSFSANIYGNDEVDMIKREKGRVQGSSLQSKLLSPSNLYCPLDSNDVEVWRSSFKDNERHGNKWAISFHGLSPDDTFDVKLINVETGDIDTNISLTKLQNSERLGGTFTLLFRGKESLPISPFASALDMSDALHGLGSLGLVQVEKRADFKWDIFFLEPSGSLPLLTYNDDKLNGPDNTCVRIQRESQGKGSPDVWKVVTKAEHIPQKQQIKISADSGTLSGYFRLSVDLTSIGGSYAESEAIDHKAIAKATDERTTWSPGSGPGESMQSKIIGMLEKATSGMDQIYRFIDPKAITVTRTTKTCIKRCKIWSLDEVPRELSPLCSRDDDCDICVGSCKGVNFNESVIKKKCTSSEDCLSGICEFSQCMADGSPCISNATCAKKGKCDTETCTDIDPSGGYTWSISLDAMPYTFPMIKICENSLVNAVSPKASVDVVMSRVPTRPESDANFISGEVEISINNKYRLTLERKMPGHYTEVLTEEESVLIWRSNPDLEGGYIWYLVFTNKTFHNTVVSDGSALTGIGASVSVNHVNGHAFENEHMPIKVLNAGSTDIEYIQGGVQISGTMDEINQMLRVRKSVVFNPVRSYWGNVQIQATLIDKQDALIQNSISLTVKEKWIKPRIIVPSHVVQVIEDSELFLSEVSIVDRDPLKVSRLFSVELYAEKGSLSLQQVYLSNNTIENINFGLSKTKYIPEQDSEEVDVISIRLLSQEGDVITSNSFVVDVLPINDHCSISLLGSDDLIVDEDTSLLIQVSINDGEKIQELDRYMKPVKVTLNVQHGNITLKNRGPIHFIQGDAVLGSPQLIIFASFVDLEHLDISYTPHSNYYGLDTLNILVSDGDQRNSQYKFMRNCSFVQSISILAINDAPTIKLNTGSQNQVLKAMEDTDRSLSGLISVNDVDMEGFSKPVRYIKTSSIRVPQVHAIRTSANPGFGKITGTFRLAINLTHLGGTYAETSDIDHAAVAMYLNELTTWSPGTGRGESMESKLLPMLKKAQGNMSVFLDGVDLSDITVSRSSITCKRHCKLAEIPLEDPPECSHDSDCDLCAGVCSNASFVTNVRCIRNENTLIDSGCPINTGCSLSQCLSDEFPCTSNSDCNRRGICESGSCANDETGGHTWSITFNSAPQIPLIQVLSNDLYPKLANPIVANDPVLSRPLPRPMEAGNFLTGSFDISLAPGSGPKVTIPCNASAETVQNAITDLLSKSGENVIINNQGVFHPKTVSALTRNVLVKRSLPDLENGYTWTVLFDTPHPRDRRWDDQVVLYVDGSKLSGHGSAVSVNMDVIASVNKNEVLTVNISTSPHAALYVKPRLYSLVSDVNITNRTVIMSSYDIRALNLALRELLYRPSQNRNSIVSGGINDEISVTVSDTKLSTHIKLSVNIDPVNDPPVVTLPGESYDSLFKTGDQLSFLVTGVSAYPVFEDVETLIEGISIRDIDAWESMYSEDESPSSQAGMLEVSLGTVNGSISLGRNPAVEKLIAGNRDGSFSKFYLIRATVESVNTALGRLKYVGGPNFYGNDELVITVTDFGNTGGNSLSDSVILPIKVQAVNDIPILITPSEYIECLEDDQVIIKGLSVHDPDDMARVNVTITVANGKLSLTREEGLNIVYFGEMSGEQDSVLSFEGPISDINQALENSIYRPNLHFNTQYREADTITTIVYQSDDFGNQTMTKSSFYVHVLPVNDAPSLTVPGGHLSYVRDGRYVTSSVDVLETFEDNPLLVDGISVSDVDVSEAFEGLLQVKLEATFGNVSLKQGNGLYFVKTSVGSRFEVTVQGTSWNLNQALSQVTYTPNQDWHGNDSLIITVNDLGNEGSGGPLEDMATIPIVVIPVNDFPEWILPAEHTLYLKEDGALAIDSVQITDVDAIGVNDTLYLNVSVEFGSLLIEGTAKGRYLSINGTISELNSALQTLVYIGGTNWNRFGRDRIDSLTLVANDQGNTGTGGFRVTEAILRIKHILRLNDPPRITGIPGARVVEEPCQNSNDGESWPRNEFDAATHGICDHIVEIDVISIVEDSPLVLTGIQFEDPDVMESYEGGILAMVYANHGEIELLGGANIHGRQRTVTLKGRLTEINQIFSKIVYHPEKDYNGYDNITIWVSDQAYSGVGGPLMDEQSIPIYIKPIPDPPVWRFPSYYNDYVEESKTVRPRTNTMTVREDELYMFSGMELDYADKSTSDLDIEFLVAIHAESGILSINLDENSNIRIVKGNADGKNQTVVFYGTLENVNKAIENVVYVSKNNWNGVDKLHFFVDDLRAPGVDADISIYESNRKKIGYFPLDKVLGENFTIIGLIGTALLPILVEPVNDAPSINVSSGVEMKIVNEDEDLLVDGIFVNDIDNDMLSLNIYAYHGTLKVNKSTGLFLNDPNNLEQLRGETTYLNEALSTLTYTGNKDWSGSDTISIKVSDDHGASSTVMIDIYVVAINDPPVIDVTRDDAGWPIHSLVEQGKLVLAGKAKSKLQKYQYEQQKDHGLELWRTEMSIPVHKTGKWGNGKLDWRYSLVRTLKSNSIFGSSPEHLTVFNEKIFFAADTEIFGTELWMSDGSFNGTTLVKDIFPGEESSHPAYLNVHNNLLYFAASGIDMTWNLITDECDGRKRSTYIPAIVYVVSDNNVWDPSKTYDCPKYHHWASTAEIVSLLGETYDPYDIISQNENNELIYSDQCGWSHLTWEGKERRTFRFSDSVTTGAYLDGALPEDHPPLLDSTKIPTGTHKYNNFAGIVCIDSRSIDPFDCEKMPFDSQTGRGPCQRLSGNELWVSDGSEDGTFRVADINPGSAGSHPKFLTSFQGWMYFQATTLQHGSELWKTNGTRDSTYLVEDIRTGVTSSFPMYFSSDLEENLLFFQAEDDWHGAELWTTTGDSNAENLAYNREYTQGYNAQKVETDGGKLTRMVLDIYPGSGSSEPTEITPLCGKYVGFAATGQDFGRELWFSDGSPEGTFMAADVNKGPQSSHPKYLTVFGDSIYFSADDGRYGVEIWKVDFACNSSTIFHGNATMLMDIEPGKLSSNPTYLKPFKPEQSADPSSEKLYFMARDSSEFWETDGTRAGTRRVFQATGSDLFVGGEMLEYDDSLFFSAKKVKLRGGSPLKSSQAQFSNAQTRAIQLYDIDSELIFVNISATKGLLSLGHSESESEYIYLSGEPETLSEQLNGIQYRALPYENGPAKINITVKDTDASNATSHTVTQIIDVFIKPVNDPPVIKAPHFIQVTCSVGEEMHLTGISVNDPDIDESKRTEIDGSISYGLLRVNLSTKHGHLSIEDFSRNMVSFQSGSGRRDKDMTFTSNQYYMNKALESLSYSCDEGKSAEDKLTITINDNGNSGEGGEKSSTFEVILKL